MIQYFPIYIYLFIYLFIILWDLAINNQQEGLWERFHGD